MKLEKNLVNSCGQNNNAGSKQLVGTNKFCTNVLLVKLSNRGVCIITR
jgi:hypothetical protein